MDTAQRYAQARHRVVRAVTALPGRTREPVPACPGWSVHDVVAHLAGACADILRGNVKGAATDAWTAQQVALRRDRSTDEVLQEWQAVAPPVERLAPSFPGRTGQQWAMDLLAHEHDIAGALGVAAGQPADDVAFALDFLIAVGLHPAVSVHGLPPLHLATEHGSWIAGTGEPRPTDDDASTGQLLRKRWDSALLHGEDRPPATSADARVDAPAAELFRALTGRRSHRQIRSFGWNVDPTPYLDVLAFGPFHIPSHDVLDLPSTT